MISTYSQIGKWSDRAKILNQLREVADRVLLIKFTTLSYGNLNTENLFRIFFFLV